MDLGLANSVALVTGGARGIGAATVTALVREGCHVAVVDRDFAAAEALCGSLATAEQRVSAHEADVAHVARAERVLEEVVEAHGRLDLLICNAGITRDAVSWKMSEAQFDEVLAVNLKGCFAYCRAAAMQFKQQQAGRIINVASINGLRGKFGQANYTAAKAGMIGMSKTLARELGRYGVTVNVVAPGMVRTEMAAELPADVVAQAETEAVLGRIAEPADVANAVVFLASAAAKHITGEVIRVDGGQYI